MSDKTELLMEFIDESNSFVLGFECGMIWKLLRSKDKILKHPVHLENSAQIQMICDFYNVKCTITPTADIWAELTVDYKK